MLAPLMSYAQTDGAMLQQHVKDTYARLTTYQDEGVTTVTNSDKIVTIPFRNFYLKPNKVRFECTLSRSLFSFLKDDYAAWCNGTNYYFSSYGKIEKMNSIHSAWGGARGISRGTSPHISSFLLQRPIGSGVYKGKGWTVVGNDKIRNIDCIHVAVKQWGGEDTHVWISSQDYMIRRIVDDDKTIEYLSISTNSPVDESLFMSK